MDWYDYYFNPNRNDDDPACDEAYDFADYVWGTYLHQIDYTTVKLGEFDIEKAKDCELCTKDLRKVTVLCFDSTLENEYTGDLIASVKDFNGEEVIIRYNKNGIPCDKKYDANEYALCIVKKKCIGYINLLSMGKDKDQIVYANTEVYKTEQDAKNSAKELENYLETIKIEYHI